eukprot:692165-Hanusia_phi.AAC.5
MAEVLCKFFPRQEACRSPRLLVVVSESTDNTTAHTSTGFSLCSFTATKFSLLVEGSKSHVRLTADSVSEARYHLERLPEQQLFCLPPPVRS